MSWLVHVSVVEDVDVDVVAMMSEVVLYFL